MEEKDIKKYEVMFILNPSLNEEEKNKSIDEIKKIIEINGGNITKEDIWGERDLAYEINKNNKGYYFLLYLEIDGLKIKEITKELNLKTNIYRYMFVNI